MNGSVLRQATSGYSLGITYHEHESKYNSEEGLQGQSLYILCGMNKHFSGWVHVLSPAMFSPYARKRHGCDSFPLDLRVPLRAEGSQNIPHQATSIGKIHLCCKYHREMPGSFPGSCHISPASLKSSEVRKPLQPLCSAFALGLINLQPLRKVQSTRTAAESLEAQACVSSEGRDLSPDAGFLVGVLHHCMANVSYDK